MSKTKKILVGIFVAVAFLGIFFVYNYSQAMDNVEKQEFVKAKQNFERIPFARNLFENDYQYVTAGALLENKRYSEAAEAFRKLPGDYPIPESVLDKFLADTYSFHAFLNEEKWYGGFLGLGELYTFTMVDRGEGGLSFYSNMPHEKGNFDFSSGIYSVNNVKQFKVTIRDMDKVSVFFYETGKIIDFYK